LIREPFSSPDVELILNGLEKGSDTRLLNAVCDAIDLICDHGDSAKARAQMLITKAGTHIWKTSVRERRFDWCVLWEPQDGLAVIYFIGEL
jgi:hypothetical protein